MRLLRAWSLNVNVQNVAQNGVVLELRRTAASQNCHSCQFAVKGATTTKAMSFCAWISSVTALVCKQCSESRVLYEKEEEELEKKKEERKKERKKGRRWRNPTFRRSVSQLPRTQRYVREYVCELLRSIVLSACLHCFGACSFFSHYLGATKVW